MNYLNAFDSIEKTILIHRQQRTIEQQEEYIKSLRGLNDALQKKNEALQERIRVLENLYRIIGENHPSWKNTSNTKDNDKHKCECKCNKPLISKEVFVETMNAIQEGYKRRNKFSDALEEVNEGWFICNLGELWVHALINLLCIVMNDTVDRYEKYNTNETLIEWWLYEDSRKLLIKDTSTGDVNEVDLTTPEQLYDYLLNRD